MLSSFESGKKEFMLNLSNIFMFIWVQNHFFLFELEEGITIYLLKLHDVLVATNSESLSLGMWLSLGSPTFLLRALANYFLSLTRAFNLACLTTYRNKWFSTDIDKDVLFKSNMNSSFYGLKWEQRTHSDRVRLVKTIVWVWNITNYLEIKYHTLNPNY